jgi:hypothetical protein
MRNKKLATVEPTLQSACRSRLSLSHAKALLEVHVQRASDATASHVDSVLESIRSSGSGLDEEAFHSHVAEVGKLLDRRARAAVRDVLSELHRTGYIVNETTRTILAASIDTSVKRIYAAARKKLRAQQFQSISAAYKLNPWPAKSAKAG